MRPTSRAKRREACREAMDALMEEMEAWYAAHPEATFGELEEKLRQERRALMGQVLEILINRRQHDSEAEEPLCPSCERPMRFEGYRRRTVVGLEGESELERAYYRCPHGCGEGFFPPGPPAPSALGPLE